MINFKHISYKNFLSVGNQPLEYDFIEDQFYLIMGKNGSGKCLRGSTKLDIEIEDASTQKKFERFLENRKNKK